MRLLLLTSPAAGNTDADSLEQAAEVLREHGDVDVVETSTPAELDEVLGKELARGATDHLRIVVAGGDGSLHAVIAGLRRQRALKTCRLGLVPLGTGNDFARAVGIPTDARQAAQIAATGRPQPLDLLVDDEDGVGVNRVHLGAGAKAARAGAGWKERLGRLGYAIGAVQAMLDPPVVRLRITLDGRVLTTERRRVLQVVVGNGVYVGGGAALTPDADPTDGEADVVVSTAVGPLARLGYAVGVLLKRHPRRPDVTVTRGRIVEVAGAELWCSADGELTGPHQRRRWHVEPAAYTLMTPDRDER